MAQPEPSSIKRALSPSAIITGVCLGGAVACTMLWLQARSELSKEQMAAADALAKVDQYRNGLLIEVRTTDALKRDLGALQEKLKATEEELAKLKSTPVAQIDPAPPR